MPTSNFGIGIVDPEQGSDSNTGRWWDSPKRTIEGGIAAGFKHLKILSGVHSISAVTAPIYLEWYPGGQRLTNAPVVLSAGVGLAAPNPGVSADAGPVFTAPTPVTDYFQYDNGASIIQGAYIGGLGFDPTMVTRSCVYATNLSDAVTEHNYLVGTSWANRPIFYVEPTVEAARWQMYSNHPTYRPLLIMDNTAGAYVHGWRVRKNPCYGVAATDPLISVTGTTRGWAVMHNHFEGASVPAVYFADPVNQVWWWANSGENLGGTDNLIARFDDIASFYVNQSLGDIAADGNIQINGTVYSQTTPDTGDDGRGGRDTNPTGWGRTIIAGRY